MPVIGVGGNLFQGIKHAYFNVIFKLKPGLLCLIIKTFEKR